MLETATDKHEGKINNGSISLEDVTRKQRSPAQNQRDRSNQVKKKNTGVEEHLIFLRLGSVQESSSLGAVFALGHLLNLEDDDILDSNFASANWTFPVNLLGGG